MRIGGKCHCGNIVFTHVWPAKKVAARPGGRGFFVKHGGRATGSATCGSGL